MQKRDFETYQKRFRDFEILLKFSEIHVFRGAIRHPCDGVVLIAIRVACVAAVERGRGSGGKEKRRWVGFSPSRFSPPPPPPPLLRQPPTRAKISLPLESLPRRIDKVAPL